MYANTNPFYWGTSVSTKNPAMLVSIIPGSDNDSGLSAVDKKNILMVKAKPWIDFFDLDRPSQSDAPVEAKSDPRVTFVGAERLASGIIAVAAAISSLYI